MVSCSKCHDEGGFLVKGDEGCDVWRKCSCLEEKKIMRLMDFSEMTTELKQLGFSTFNKENRPKCVIEAYQTAFNYYKSFDQIRHTRQNSITLLGNPGSGKTHLLIGIINNLIQQKGVQCLYFPFTKGFNNLKADMDGLEEKINVLKSTEVLYIDDLFKGRKDPTPFVLEQLFVIINERYLSNKPTLISSERSMDELWRIDEGIASRIYEMSSHYLVEMKLEHSEHTQGLELNYRRLTA